MLHALSQHALSQHAPSQHARSPRTAPLARALALALAIAAAGTATAQQVAPLGTTPVRVDVAPPLAQMPASAQVVAPLVARFNADEASLEHVWDIRGGARRHAALQGLYADWQRRLAELPTEGLGLEDRIDHRLFGEALAWRLQQLDFERQRDEASFALVPGLRDLVALAEARRALAYPDPRASAEALVGAHEALAAFTARIEADALDGTSPIVAYRAARLVGATRDALREWHGQYAGYDPDFSWWTRQPWEALDPQLERTQALLRERLAGAADPERIIGDPIGRDAIVAGLRHEMIADSPEQLMALAERELAWCREEMERAAREMGLPGWREALEAVKQRHPPPGGQPRLVVELADEAIDYLVDNDLVTVPEIARRDWRMTMLTPEYQLQAPFFLGGEDVWVAFPTDTMPHEKKLMALRGNNRHFSRAVVHHELIPGHHLQHFYTGRYQTHRGLYDTPFWTEGWALYWELALYERGFAATPEDRIGMLFWRSHRAARILFSLGFHMGEMTPEEAVALLVERVGHEPENARAEVRRSFAGDYGPLYQAGYLLGGLQIQQLARELVGEGEGRMSPRAFHDAILTGGPMPIAMVRARLTGELPEGEAAHWRFTAR